MTSRRLNLVLGIILIALMFASLFAGRVSVPFSDWLSGSLQSVIVTELRLPRAMLGGIIGAALGMSGAAMQGYLRNPLADPGLFGVSSSAALGAVCSLLFGFAISAWLLPLFAMAGAALGMAALALLAGRSGSLIVFTLAGVILSSLTGALTALMISLAPSPFAVTEITTWLMGALTDRSWDDVKLAAPVVALGMIITGFAARDLDGLTLGETAARSLGVNMRRLQWMIALGVGLCVGVSVAVAGVIGFVGLVVPHLVRPLIGNKPSALLIPSALAGAILIVLSDAIVRLLPTAAELRLGIAMSVLGAPFFLALLIKMRRETA
jgi:iron complex transport system permease protein